MYCYIYRNAQGKITAYDQTTSPKPAPAIQVSVEEFKKLGFYRAPSTQPVPEEPSESQSETDELSAAILKGVNSV